MAAVESSLREYLRAEILRKKAAIKPKKPKAPSHKTGSVARSASAPSLPDPDDDSSAALIKRARANFEVRLKKERAWEENKKNSMKKAREKQMGLYAVSETGYLLTAYERQLKDLEFEHNVRGKSYGKPCDRQFGI